MADITVTPANVLLTSGAAKSATAGATITAGQPLYLDSSDSNKAKPCQSDDVAAQAACVGIALNGASSGQPVSYAPPGSTINTGSTVVVGMSYYVSDTAGGIIPSADVSSGEFVTFLGVATTAALLPLNIVASGVEVP